MMWVVLLDLKFAKATASAFPRRRMPGTAENAERNVKILTAM